MRTEEWLLNALPALFLSDLGSYREFTETWFGVVSGPEGPLKVAEGWEGSEDEETDHSLRGLCCG